MSSKIITSNGFEIVIDDQDYADLSRFSWHFSSSGYASRSYVENGEKRTELMHRRLLGLRRGDGRVGDHISANKKDNRRCNLREATPSQNMQNSRRRIDNKSGHKGVSWDSSRSKWVARIKRDGAYKMIGRFSEIGAAIAAYQSNALDAFGEFANFGNAP